MFPIVEDTTKKFTKYIQDKISENSGTALDARNISDKFTCDVTSSCAFGLDAQSFSTDHPKILEMGQKILQPNFKLFFLFMLIAVVPNIMKILKIGFVPKDVEKFFIQLMEDAIKYREENKIDRNDYLEYLINLKNKKELTTLDMAAHGITFFTDGFETSSVAISHAFYEVCWKFL
jgi:cytochrome P450 family 6/cytochrome P450 family 28